MDTALALVKARQLMNKYGLNDWRLNLDRRKCAFGYCRPVAKIISLSEHLVGLNSEEQVTDTILHEIAHALDWIRNGKMGHDYSWKRICIEIGAKPEQYYTDATVVSPDPKYIIKAIASGKVCGKYHRLPTKGISTQYQLFDDKGQVIKPSYLLKNEVTGRTITYYYGSLPKKVLNTQQFLFETGKPSTKGQLKLYKVS